ncbi:unnamed protein product [Urochloa humidicola]
MQEFQKFKEEAAEKYNLAIQERNEAREANKELTMQLNYAKMKATQLEACLKKEEQELVWRKEVESLFAELQLMKQEKKELKVKLKKAEHKN